MPEEGSMADNMAKGKGIVAGEKGKDDFNVVGMDASDRAHPEITGESERGRGRPAKDQNFTQVGPDVEGEQGTKKSG